MKLSNSFTLEEFTKSPTAIRMGIPNIPSEKHIENMTTLCKLVIQPLRDHYGKPIHINSGYRGEFLNARLMGSDSSQHCDGEAADIDTLEDNADLFYYIRDHLEFDQIIWEYGDKNNPDWVHVSYKQHNRMQCLRTVRQDDGSVRYEACV